MAPAVAKPVKWPVAASAVMALGSASEVGGLPVQVGPPRAGMGALSATPASVRVEVVDAAEARRAGYPLLLRVSQLDGPQAGGRVRLEVGYSAFRDAFGADWDNRLTMVTLPACVLQTPEVAGCASQTVLESVNQYKAGTLSAEVDLSSAGVRRLSQRQAALEGASETDGVVEPLVVGVIAAGSSDIGDFTKTDFHPDYSWAAGGNSGDFSFSYPMQVPPVAGSLAPQVALNYSSGNVDGQTVGVNVQPFWGEGWNYTPGYIERAYRTCKDEVANSPVYTITTSDNCWRLPNARMVLGGKSVELVLGDDGKWRADNDDAARVELLTGGTGTGYFNNERWKVSTTEGSVYYFGLTRLPGWTAGDRVTDSVLGIPVFSNHSGDPCLDAQGTGWTNSWCMMAYRWNLDYVVDRNGNTMSYWYNRETNKTARAGDPNSVSTYDRFGRLSHIEYGTRGGTGATRESAPISTPPARVLFTNVDRCLSGSCPTHDRANYPDTAWDLDCAGTSCPNNMTPSFWAAKRVSTIATEIYSGAGTAYQRVDEWALGAEFPADASGNPLWLTSITRTGKVGGTASLPSMLFYGTRFRNRADWDPAGTMADPQKYRITSVRTEAGGQVEVTYAGQDAGCQFGLPFPDPDNNASRCFPRYWTNPTGSPGWAWWHKYVVEKVVEKDLFAGSPDKQTAYSYGLDGAASASGPVVLWAYDKGGQVFSSSTGFRSWADWRGYSTVTATTGTVAGQQSQTKTLYFRGLNGDRTDGGYFARTATVTNSLGEVSPDEAPYAGMVHESQTLDGPGGQVLTKSISDPSRWLTGTREMGNAWSIPPTQWSYIARTTRQRSMTYKTWAGTWVTAEQVSTFNTTYGVVDTVDDRGDTATSADDMCVRHWYTFPPLNAPYLIAYPNRVQTVGVNCATAPVFPADAVAETRSFYDGAAAYATAPTKGNLTKLEAVVSYTAGTPDLITTQTSGYDAWGRITSVKDGLGHETQTVYTHTGGLPSSVKAINALGHELTATLDRARGLPLSATDANLKVSTGQYDPLGRLTKVWRPGHPTSGIPDVEYQYTLQQGAPSFIRTRTLGPNANQIDAYEIYDGFSRLRQTQSTAPDSKRVIEDLQYDRRGLPAKRSVFYNSVSGPNSTLYNVDAAADALIEVQHRLVYDRPGRVTDDELWSLNVFKFKTSTIYQGDRAVTVPPSGALPSQDLFDGRGRLKEKRLFLTSDLAGNFDSTIYQYDKAGRLATVKDPLNNQWTYQYDLLGRKTKQSDPDAGDSEYTYDNAGRILTSKDNRGVVLAYAYDDIDRKTAVHEGTLAGFKRAGWLYDTVDKGQLTSASRFDATATYTTTVGSYDDGYRPETVTQTIPGFGTGGTDLTYTVTNTYKTNGSIATQALPAAGGLPAETLTYGYAPSGVPTTITSGQATYISNTLYGYDGQVSRYILGTAGTQTRITNTFDPATRRTTIINTETETATPNTFTTRHINDYAYDPAGNLTGAGTLVEGVRDQFECYRYDYLRRLTEAWSQPGGGIGCGTPQRTGADPYWRQWTYDKIGNRLTQTNKNPAAGDTTWTYTVGAAGAVKAHQVKTITTTGTNPEPTRSFDYDQAGNTTSRTTPSGTAQTLTWDKEGHLATLTEAGTTTTYTYDPGGKRLISSNPNKKTLYLADGTELEKIGTADPLATRFYQGIAIRDTAGLRWIAADHHGTSVVQIDATTLSVQRRRALPYGEDRTATPAGWKGTKGYVGGTKDDTGLTHLGAREYDPSSGRFVSVDPVMDLGDPTQWNAYSYASNNPTTFSDPSGLKPMFDDLADQKAWQTSGGNKFPGNSNKKRLKGYFQHVPSSPAAGILKGLYSAWWEYNSAPYFAGKQAYKYGEEQITNAANGEQSWQQAYANWSTMTMMAALGSIASTVMLPVQAVEHVGAAIEAGNNGDWEGVGKNSFNAAADIAEIATLIITGPKLKCNSFAPATPVLLADGTFKRIGDVQIGDLVLATDPETGDSGPHEVTDLIVGEGDKQLADIAIQTTDGEKTITATTNHPFWVQDTSQWIDAGQLTPGTRLRSPDGTSVTVNSVQTYTLHAKVNNLTVADIHTYYVLAGNTPVLVHNTDGPDLPQFRDGLWWRFNYQTARGEVEGWAFVKIDGNKIMFDNVGVYGPGRKTLDQSAMLRLVHEHVAPELERQGYTEVRIRGVRTTGRKPGHTFDRTFPLKGYGGSC